LAGSNFWAWGGDEKGKDAGRVWRRGDPLIGDPPQEAQGLNAVFSTDRSMIDVISEHAFKMLRPGTADTLYADAERKPYEK
jgi:mannan endo-1,4-beta-mannosidase